LLVQMREILRECFKKIKLMTFTHTRKVLLKESKNLIRYRSEKVFVTDHQNNYVEAQASMTMLQKILIV